MTVSCASSELLGLQHPVVLVGEGQEFRRDAFALQGAEGREALFQRDAVVARALCTTSMGLFQSATWTSGLNFS